MKKENSNYNDKNDALSNKIKNENEEQIKITISNKEKLEKTSVKSDTKKPTSGKMNNVSIKQVGLSSKEENALQQISQLNPSGILKL